MLGVSASTLRRLEKDGKIEGFGLNVYYTPGGQRRYHYNEVKSAYDQWGISGTIGPGERPCIIVLNLIRYFTDPASKAWYEQDEVVHQTKSLLHTASEYNIPVIFISTIFDEKEDFSVKWAKKIETHQLLVKGTIWTEIDPKISDFSFKEIISTPFISSFHKSSLLDILNREKIDTVILAGNNTSGNIRFTAMESMQYGFNPIIVREAVGDRSITAHQTALMEIDAKYGDVMSLEDVNQYLEKVWKSFTYK
jgi:nicotinamidase-related amidase